MESDGRFKSLIQPIRDLAANWDIDIAEDLTQYLDELENIRIKIDNNNIDNDGSNTINFAEAALLIQGSTNVYSKKVEYLYQLVLQSLDYLTKNNNKNKNKSSNNNNNNNSDDIDDILNISNNISFLLLDDIIEEGTNINIKTVNNDNNNSRRLSGQLSTSNDISRVSMSMMHSLLSDGNGGTGLKLSSSFVDSSGTLLLGDMPFTSTIESGDNNNSKYNEDLDLQDNGDAFDYNNDQWDGADDFDAMPSHVSSTNHGVEMITPGKNLDNIINKKQTSMAPSQVQNKVNTDAFAMLDPHSETEGSRPLRKGRTYKIPTALNITDQDERRAFNYQRLLQKSLHTIPLNWKNKVTTTAAVDIEEERSISVPSKGLFNPSLMPILKIRRKEQRKLTLAQNKAENGKNFVSNELITSWRKDYYDLDNDNVGDNDYDDGFNDNDMDDFVNEVGDAGNSYVDGVPDLEEMIRDSHESVCEMAGFDEEMDLQNRVRHALEESMKDDDERDGSGVVQSYEAICRKYIDNFNHGAQAYARETQLSRRVSEWTRRLEPILQKQEEEVQFDIHKYSDNLIYDINHAIAIKKQEHLVEEDQNTSQIQTETITFSEVVAGKPRGEVCRVFLACLQLINQGNITILKGNSNENNSIDTFQLPLPGPSILNKGNKGRQTKNSKKDKNKSVSFAASPFKSHQDFSSPCGSDCEDDADCNNDASSSLSSNSDFAPFMLRLNTSEKLLDISKFLAPSVASQQNNYNKEINNIVDENVTTKVVSKKEKKSSAQRREGLTNYNENTTKINQANLAI